MSVILDRPIFHGAAPQAMFLIEACGNELETAIGQARMNYMLAQTENDADKWSEVIHILRDQVNLC